jgi:hypothetical protein
VPCGRLAAVVSPIHSSVSRGADDFERYGEVLRRLEKCCREVHAVAFGIVVRDERVLCRALRRIIEGPSLPGTALELAISELGEEGGRSHGILGD